MLLLTLVCHCFFFKVRTIQVEKKISEIVNRLNKTKEEKVVNLRELREERDRLEREGNKKKLREQVCLFNYSLRLFFWVAVLNFKSFVHYVLSTLVESARDFGIIRINNFSMSMHWMVDSQGGAYQFGYCQANWPALRTILTVWFDYLVEIFFFVTKFRSNSFACLWKPVAVLFKTLMKSLSSLEGVWIFFWNNIFVQYVTRNKKKKRKKRKGKRKLHWGKNGSCIYI